MKVPINKNFSRVLVAMMISVMGSQAYYVGESLLLKHVTGSGWIVGLTLALASLPTFFFGVFGGAVADHYDRKKIMVVADIVGSAASISLALIVLMNLTGALVPWVMCTTVVLGSSQAFFRPASRALLPRLVESASLGKANSIYWTARDIASIVGQSVAGVVYAAFNAGSLFLSDGLSYLISALLVRSIRTSADTAAVEQRTAPIKFRARIAEGFRYIRRVEGLGAMIATLCVMDLFLAPLMTMLPFYVEDTLKLGPSWYGILYAALSVGAVLGGSLSGLIQVPERARRITIPLMLVVTGLSRCALGMTHSPYIAFVAIALETGSSIFFSIAAETVIQQRVQDGYLGRVMGLLSSLMGALTPAGMLLGGVAVSYFHGALPEVIVASGAALVLVAIAPLASAQYRRFFDGGASPALTEAFGGKE